LKEAIIGGFDKIFEVARVFRNEGMDPSHLQEFTMIEHYCAYWNFEDNMDFTEKMFTEVIGKLIGDLKIETYNKNDELIEVDLSTPWRRVSFRELLLEDCGIDIDQFQTVGSLREAIKEKGIKIEDMEKLGRGNLIDSLYKKVSRPKLVDPVFLINHPIDLSPLARKNDKNEMITDRFQLIINGWEIVNAYSELIDPVDQKERFSKQVEAKEMGDEEAMDKDDDYLEAMEYGMPPVSGWGMGVERIVALLTKQKNLRDVVLFPLLRPKE
jgi:lysyl-tRNA synthetase class 2